MPRDQASHEKAVPDCIDVLECLPYRVAVLAPDGAVLQVNNCGGSPGDGVQGWPAVGTNYVAMLQDTLQPESSCSDAAEQVQAVLLGHVERCSFESRCGAGRPESRVKTTVTRLRNCAGAVVCQVDVIDSQDASKCCGPQLDPSLALECLGNVATGIAHDFNNLLTAILGYNEVAQTLAQGNDDLMQVMSGIDQVCGQAIGVTRSLLAFSGKASSKKGPLDIVQFTDYASAMLRALLPPHIEIVREFPTAHDLWIEGESIGLQRVLIELAADARKSMIRGGRLRLAIEACSMKTSTRESDIEAVRLIVESDGQRLATELRSSVPYPGSSTHPGDCAALSTVHEIIADHGGCVEVASTNGGMRVSLTFPRSKPSGVSAPAENVVSARGHGEIVVLAEDDPQVRQVITDALRSAMYQVVIAEDGEQALAAFRHYRDRIQLLVLDIDLPKLSGIDCLKEVRAQCPSMPVIMISGLLEMHFDEDWATDVGLLAKPFKTVDVVAAVGAILTGSRPAMP